MQEGAARTGARRSARAVRRTAVWRAARARGTRWALFHTQAANTPPPYPTPQANPLVFFDLQLGRVGAPNATPLGRVVVELKADGATRGGVSIQERCLAVPCCHLSPLLLSPKTHAPTHTTLHTTTTRHLGSLPQDGRELPRARDRREGLRLQGQPLPPRGAIEGGAVWARSACCAGGSCGGPVESCLRAERH